MLQELITWSNTDKIRLHLPILFRAKYTNVVAKADCLEIQIVVVNTAETCFLRKLYVFDINMCVIMMILFLIS